MVSSCYAADEETAHLHYSQKRLFFASECNQVKKRFLLPDGRGSEQSSFHASRVRLRLCNMARITTCWGERHIAQSKAHEQLLRT
jgi:hypothetical protein